tara:strand:- start:114 stop:482 length:369 start_codon:yes stop_codon:yes gene_type:complete
MRPAQRASIAFLYISLFSIQVIIPPGFMPSSIVHGEFIKLCHASFPKNDVEVLHSSHHHHEEEEVSYDCVFTSHLPDPIFFAQEIHVNASGTHDTDFLINPLFIKSSPLAGSPRAPPYLRNC